MNSILKYVKPKPAQFLFHSIAIAVCCSCLAKGNSGDPLSELIQQGVQNAFGLQSQRLDLDKARNEEKNSYASLLPTISLSASRTLAGSEQVDSTTQNISSSWSNTPSASVVANWTIWNNYANVRNIQLAGKSKQAAFQNGSGGLAQYVLNLLSEYFNYESALMRRDILRSQLVETNRTFEQAQTLVKAGAKTKLDSVDAEIDLVNTERDLMEADNNLKASVRNLAAMLNKPDLQDLPTIDMLTYRPYYMGKFEETLPQIKKMDSFKASELNPNLKLAKLSLETQELTLKQTKLNYFPTTSITASHTVNLDGLIDPSLANGRRTALHSDQVMLSLNWQFWDWFSTYRTIENSEKTYEQSLLNYNQTKLATATNIQNLLEQYDVLQKSLHATELAVKKAQEQLDYSQTMYRLGRIDLLMMQQSVRRMATAKTELASRLASKYIMAAQILYSTGNPVHPAESEPEWLKNN